MSRKAEAFAGGRIFAPPPFFTHPLKARSGSTLFFLTTFLLISVVARAHDTFSSWTDVYLRADQTELVMTLGRVSALRLLPDHNALPPISPANFGEYAPRLKAVTPELFELSVAGLTLPLTSADVTLSGDEDVEFRLHFTKPNGSPLRLFGNYLQFLVDGHVGTLVVKTTDDTTIAWSPISIDQPTLDVTLPSTAVAAGSPAAPPASPSFGTFVKLGVHHIWIGYDHLLFLFGLIVVCRRFMTMAAIITCFTLAHSITLALAAFDVLTLSPRIVEPLIAASIVYVGVENLVLRGREPQHRGWLTFSFGLIHGFGFAGALKEVSHDLAGRALALPLFSFNLGVELGQIAVAAICLPLILLLRRSAKFERWGPPAISSLIVLAGGYWLLQRTVFS